MSSELSISIIIPFYNAKQHIKKLFRPSEGSRFQKTFEVIMVDDGSNDDSFRL